MDKETNGDDDSPTVQGNNTTIFEDSDDADDVVESKRLLNEEEAKPESKEIDYDGVSRETSKEEESLLESKSDALPPLPSTTGGRRSSSITLREIVLKIVLSYHSSSSSSQLGSVEEWKTQHFAGHQVRLVAIDLEKREESTEKLASSPVPEGAFFVEDYEEITICLLTSEYARTIGSFERASEALENDKLAIFLMAKLEELPEEWQSLYQSSSWQFSCLTPEELSHSLVTCVDVLKLNETITVAQIDDFIIQEEIGRGAQGTVYRAVHQLTGEHRAVKEVHCHRGISVEVKTEIAVMKRLSHPHVCKMFDVYSAPEAPTTIYLVIEYVEGGSIFTDPEVWHGGLEPMGLVRAKHVFQQLACGLSYMHFMGILHRDIKPSNVLGFKDDGPVKLSDFGVSSFTKRHKSLRVLGEDDIITVGSCGTPAFLCPEAVGAGHDVVYHGRSGDVWALGVTFYCFVTGALPFRGKNKKETMQLIGNNAPVRFPTTIAVNPLVRDLLIRMLEKDPKKRITLQAVLSHPLIDVPNWKASLSAEQLVNPVVTPKELQESISLPKMVQKSRRKVTMKIKAMVSSTLTTAERAMKTSNLSSSWATPRTQKSIQTSVESGIEESEHSILEERETQDPFLEFFSSLGCSCGGDRKQ